MKKESKKAVILVVDDEESLRDSMKILLEDDYDVVFAVDGREALRKVKSAKPDLVLLDVKLPEIDGMEVLRRIKGSDPEIEVVMVTAMNTVQYAVEAIKSGAYDYITKPFDIDSISSIVEKIIEKKDLERENKYLKEEISKKYQFEKIIGASPALQEIFTVISEISRNDSTVLIYGESGTGKELAARAIHNLSPRSNKLFVPINCAAIPENLLESELFGHERGAFTGAFERKLGKFEIAEGGTIFLDEIGSMSHSLQGKLLRVLQEKEFERVGSNRPIKFDVRVISATNKNLQRAIKEEKFRNDLFFRLNVIPITLPPLRERREDIPLLIDHFLSIYNSEFGKKVKGFSKDALDSLIGYKWPGNVRELQNLIERLVALSKERIIAKAKLPSEILGLEMISEAVDEDKMDYKKATYSFEAAFIKKALQKTGGKKSKAAELMGVHRNTLLNMRRKLKSTSL